MKTQSSALVLTLALTMAGSAVAQDTSWAGDVREDGWPSGRVTVDGDMIVFRRPGPKGPEGHPRLQIRYEYRDGMKMGGRAYFSMLALDEYDCKAGRFRNVRMAAFTGHNAEGQSIQDDSGEAWKAPAAGTVDAKSLAAACGR
jgi:hypothetical protein